MGIKNLITKAGSKAADSVARLAVLSPEQLKVVQARREAYLSEVPNMDDEAAEELTSRLLAAGSVDIFNAYLQQIPDMYVPIKRDIEYGTDFRSEYNIRYFEITKWVTNIKENSLEKLVNVYEVLSNEDCNIALIFNRICTRTRVYIAVTNTNNADDNTDVENYKKRLMDAIKGNFPGSELSSVSGTGTPDCIDKHTAYSVACTSNIPGEKSEKFVSQTIEKLLDGIVPENSKQEYTLILLATPIRDIENRKIHLAELYSGLAPYASWETNFTYTQSDSINSSATFGVNVGASAGIQQGQTQANTKSHGETDSSSRTETDSKTDGETETDGRTETDSSGQTETNSTSSSEGGSTSHTDSMASGHTEGESSGESHSDGTSSGDNIVKTTWRGLTGGETGQNASDSFQTGKNVSDSVTESTSDAVSSTYNNTATESLAKNVSRSVAKSTSKAVSKTVGKSIANTLGRAVTNTVASTSGIYKGVNLGANVGANFARSSNVTATVGKNEGIVQHFTNYTIKHVLENLELQTKRLEQSTALGMWDFSAYVLSEDSNTANNVAYSYLALTQGEKSYVSQAAVNLWRGDMTESDDAKEICGYLQDLRHPIFALNPNLTAEVPISNVYPPVITATTSLSGKELAYSLNFPSKSVAGLPVIKCAEFGRDITTYSNETAGNAVVNMGNIFHMNHSEPTDVDLSLQSLASHMFITGSTGSGKSNTVYRLIEEASEHDIHFLVIEPAKGEYKNVFGNEYDVEVYGTNPALSKLLRINPFSFPARIHIYEHMDRLVEIFNVCWPMYAAMPAVLKEAIEKSYVDCGWDLIRSVNTYRCEIYPTFSDVARNIKTIIESSEYDAENKGAYKGSLLTRLQSLANGINGVVFTDNEIKPEDLFDKNVIIDLSRVGSMETKSLLMGMLVLKLQEYRMSTASSNNAPLKHITVLEEAHNILKRTSTEQPMEGANLIGKSVEMISNAIAEMRTYGEGFIIVDQAPGLMDMSVIRNTNTKMIMRLPDQGDRELVGKAANLDDEQIKELAKLPCGVAAVYQNEWIQPVLCKVEKVDTFGKVFNYTDDDAPSLENNMEKRFKLAEILSKGLQLGKEISRGYVGELLRELHISGQSAASILDLLSDPPKEPDMEKLAPVMNRLFPDVTKSIKKWYSEEVEVTQWTREANELIAKYGIDEQVRRDIIQSSLTYYLTVEINNRPALDKWCEQKGVLI